ncbi:ATP-dependent DNA helicase Q5 [Nymphon striatum]|nr:ATP-dependent DNA helicase Q5 [Nymphon striatum]
MDDDTEIKKKLFDVFGYVNFKSDLQKNAVRGVAYGDQDVFICLPTGAGKSLCFQLPSVIKEYGITIVISPLIALINDQLEYLKKLGIQCATVNSMQSRPQQNQTYEDITSKNPKTRLLYITPELAVTPRFKERLKIIYSNKMLQFFAVDEAHCVSQWGHDFRTDYSKIGRLKKLIPKVKWVALTATASNKVFKCFSTILCSISCFINYVL